MARVAWCAVLLGSGCSFTGGTFEPNADPIDASAVIDGSPRGDAEALSDAAPTKTCGVASPAGLVACFEFENTLDDVIGNVPSAQAVNGITYRAGAGGVGAAAVFDGQNYVRAGASATDYASSSVTLEMWVRPTVIPTTVRDGLADLESQLGAFIAPGGGVLCNGGWGSVTSDVALQVNVWTHVACRQTQAGGMEVFIGGDQNDCDNNQSPPGTPNDDLVIGGNSPDGSQRLTGAIDTLRYWNRALSNAELCASAGRLACAPASADCTQQ